LRSLVYAGAVVVTNRVKCPSKAPRMQQVNPQKQADVTRLRRIIGWLESEIRRRRNGRKATARQDKNMRRLKFERCFLCELETSIETQKAHLRVGSELMRGAEPSILHTGGKACSASAVSLAGWMTVSLHHPMMSRATGAA